MIIKGPAISVKFLKLQWSGTCQNNSSRAKDKLMHLAPFYKDRSTMPGRSLGSEGSTLHT